MKKRENTVLCLAVCAVMVALATVISMFLKFDATFAYGGSVTVGSAVPIILVAYLLGAKWGILTAVTYSGIQLALGVAQVAAWGLSPTIFVLCLLFDYILAYSCFAVASFFKGKKPWTLVIAGVLGCALRFLCHFISGFLFFGSWAEEGFNAFTWAIVYNGGYMLPEAIICAVICAALIPVVPTLRKILNK